MDTSQLEFIPYSGDLMGLAVTPNHLVFRWNRDDCKILFSMARQGNAATCHFASDKAGLRNIKEAIDRFVDCVFHTFSWCTMVLANIKRPSVCRLVEKVGFKWAAEVQDMQIYARIK